jgi:hypothetical protein
MSATGYSTAFLPAAVPIDEPALPAGAASAQLTAISVTLSGPKIQQVGFRATIQKEDPFCSQRRITSDAEDGLSVSDSSGDTGVASRIRLTMFAITRWSS